MTFLYLDTETLGLQLDLHDIWEIAYAFDEEPIRSGIVSHNLISAEPRALELNGYFDRGGPTADIQDSLDFERDLIRRLSSSQRTHHVVGSNPMFDMTRLERRWGGQSYWHHRPVDISAYSMGILGFDVPPGLKLVVDELNDRGYEVYEPDHTAHGDVRATREAHRALRSIIEQRS